MIWSHPPYLQKFHTGIDTVGGVLKNIVMSGGLMRAVRKCDDGVGSKVRLKPDGASVAAGDLLRCAGNRSLLALSCILRAVAVGAIPENYTVYTCVDWVGTLS